MCIRRKRVVRLVTVRYVRLGKNQAEIRQSVVPPEFGVVPTESPFLKLGTA